jgi:hypothetical protein
MQEFRAGLHCFVLLLAFMAFRLATSGQLASQTSLPTSGTPEVQHPNPKGSDPNPEPAANAILAAFDKHEVIAMSAAHGNKDLDDFILQLIRNPAFPNKVNDVVVECGNSFYQPILDRYVSGEDGVPFSDVQKAWRNTTQLMCGVSSFYEELFPVIRRINQRLPPEKRLRVLAADPPVDWNTAKSLSDIYAMDRDLSIASVMEKEVLLKHRKALMLFGIYHILHGGRLAVGLYEKDFPGVTFVIADHEGFFNFRPLSQYNGELEARMTSWPIPSLVQNVKGTWLEDIDRYYFSDRVDAYLYLGPRDLMLNEPTPAEVFLDKDYAAELQRRAAMGKDRHLADMVNPQKIVENQFNPFLYDPDELRKELESLSDK